MMKIGSEPKPTHGIVVHLLLCCLFLSVHVHLLLLLDSLSVRGSVRDRMEGMDTSACKFPFGYIKHVAYIPAVTNPFVPLRVP